MKRGIVIAVILALLGFGARAQDDTWRLRKPKAEEYLQTMIDIVPEVKAAADSPYYISPLDKISDIFFYLFPDAHQTPFPALLKFYTMTEIGKREVMARGAWMQRMIEAWINDNHINLSQTSTLEFEDFYVKVLPRDFNGDGQDEYVLDASKGGRVDRKACDQQSEIIAYYVVEQTPDGYRFVDTDLPWKGYAENGRYSYANGSMDEIGFRDLNGDGIPEWIVLVGGETYGGPGMGYVDGGGLIILSWRDNRLVYVVPSSYDPNWSRNETSLDFTSTESLCIAPYPQTVTWDFKNVDDDPALEILQVERYVNNWDCSRSETKLFNWDEKAGHYYYLKTDLAYDEASQNCSQMQAEEVMWTGDYANAIPIFERALTLKTLDLSTGDTSNYARSLNQYLRSRLAFAYLMVGNDGLAKPLLETLSNELIKDKSIESYVVALKKVMGSKASPLSVCIAAYNNFAPHKISSDSIPDIRVGYTGDDLYYYDNPYQPENIGCNAPKMLTETLQARALTSDQSPIEFLNKLDIGINHFLQTDLNNDGVSEWLVWPDVAGVEIFFAPDGDDFHISFPNVDRYRFANELRSWQLPDDAGSAIVLLRTDWHGKSLAPWYDAYDPFGGVGGGPPTCSEGKLAGSMPGEFALWELKGVELTEVFSRGACTTELNEFFPSGEGSTSLRLNYPDCADDYCDTSVMKTDIYTWDTTARNYVTPKKADVTPEPTLTPQPTATPKPFPQYYSALDAFEQRDFAAVDIMADEPLTPDNQDSFNNQLGDHYLRALALEALGRDDEALAEYVTIYEAAPESAWGILAALHFEAHE